VILCAELGRKLRDLGGKTKAQDAMMFAMTHEVGHILLRHWGYPFYDNEEVADEFATALLVLFGHGERARTAAELFEQLPLRNINTLKPIVSTTVRFLLPQ